MKHRALLVLSFVLLAPSLLTAGWNPFAPKVTFSRRVPAPNNLGPLSSVTLVELRGSDAASFSRYFATHFTGNDFMKLTDATSANATLSRLTGTDSYARDFRNAHPADVYLAINLGGCSSNMQSQARTEKKDKQTITKTYYWYTSMCNGTGRLIDAKDGRELASFSATGEGKTAESEKLYGFERTSAEDSAMQELARDLAAQFSPRNDKESIVLDKKAPAFKPAMERIKASDVAGARQLFEGELASNASSAPLHFNLAAVAEASGDAKAARQHYDEAIRLAPGEKRYRDEFGRFEQRERDKAALLVRP